MLRRNRYLLSLVLWLQVSGFASAATPPAKVVEQFIEAHMQGHFAESRGFTLERVNLSASPFSNWLFGPAGVGGNAPTADLFLSRKFTQVFRYTITGTTPTGDNQVSVTVLRTSPNLAHMYTWALAPKRGTTPYELIDAVDAYLTKINFPVEESRMQFVLVREVDSWYISSVTDEKFAQLQQSLQGQTQLSGAAPPLETAASTATGGIPGAPSGATTTSSDIGRQLADAQFNATLQGFNRTSQGLPPAAKSGSPAQPKPDEDEPGVLGKISRAIFGGKKNEVAPKDISPSIYSTLKNMHNALRSYVTSHNALPNTTEIYDWKSLRRVVNRYGKTSLPATEAEAGFTFVDYKPTRTGDSYSLLVDVNDPQGGIKRLEVNEDVDKIEPVH